MSSPCPSQHAANRLLFRNLHYFSIVRNINCKEGLEPHLALGLMFGRIKAAQNKCPGKRQAAAPHNAHRPGPGQPRSPRVTHTASSLQSTTRLMSRERVTGYYGGGKTPMGHHDYGDILLKESF